MAVMTGKELADKALDIATNYKTLYVFGAFGWPLTPANKARAYKAYDYNKRADRKPMIEAATADTFGFDCSCLIKSILWDWNGNKANANGGAKYASNGVQDYGANSMISRCSGVSTGGWAKMKVGEALWCEGHIGIYIGNGLAVECTPSWKNCVQVTAVANIGSKAGYPSRKWTKHGKLPWISYAEPIEKGDKVKVLKNKTYTGSTFRLYYKEYTVLELKGDRAVIGVNGVVTAAVNVANIEKV